MQNRARKRAEAKADGALRRERTARAAADKLQARQLEVKEQDGACGGGSQRIDSGVIVESGRRGM